MKLVSKLLSGLVASLLVMSAPSAFAGIYNDVTVNTSFATAANLNPFFSNGFNADIGMIVQCPGYGGH